MKADTSMYSSWKVGAEQKLDDEKLFLKILTRASGHTLIEITARGMVDEVLMKLVSHTEGALW